jgi:AbiV family abortive infection protein
MPKRRARQSLVLTNAARLLNDARILAMHHSFASAFALAVLAGEEIGKALIDGWNEHDQLVGKPRSPSLHIQKQTAVASLLLGTLAIRTFPEGAVTDLECNKLTAVTRMFNESGEGRLLAAIRDKHLDGRKQAAIYQDDWLIAVADDFAEEHVGAIFKIAEEARDVINDSEVRRAGRAFYEVTLDGVCPVDRLQRR